MRTFRRRRGHVRREELSSDFGSYPHQRALKRLLLYGGWICLLAAISYGKTTEFSHDLPAVVDTQVTESDEPKISRPEAASPVYYNLVAYGYVLFGDFLGADKGPNRETFLAQVVESLRTAGYLPADEQNPATVTVGVTGSSIVNDGRVATRYFSGRQHTVRWQTLPLIIQNRAYSPAFDWNGLDRTFYG